MATLNQKPDQRSIQKVLYRTRTYIDHTEAQEILSPTMPADDFPEYHSEPLVISSQELNMPRVLPNAVSTLKISNRACLNSNASLRSGQDQRIVRPFHTIKGMAGFLNLKDIQALTHEVETLLTWPKRQVPDHSADYRSDFETIDVLKVLNSIGHSAKPDDQPTLNPNQ